MNNIKSYLIATFLITVTFYACDEIMPEISDPVIPESEKVVLLEELTGATCPNCPKGTAAVEAILKTFPKKVAAIAVHGDFLAKPVPGRSKYDFRNQKAKDLENWFTPWLGKPAATINRIELNDPDQKYATVSTGLWQSMVEKELAKPNQMTLLLTAKFNPVSRVVEIDMTAIPLEDLPGNYNISVFLTESKIIDAQTNGNIIIDNFEHNHVLRDMATKFDGDALGSDLTKEVPIRRKYLYTLPTIPEGLWKAENMEVVVAVHHSAQNNRSVVQAAYKHVLE
jgi:hypothetical protein